MKLVDALNTHNPALIVLVEKGYKIGIIKSDNEEELGLWYAELNGNKFEAGDPLSLLGLVGIYEHRGIEWKKSNDKSIYSHVIGKIYED